ncbi:hypothetical protein ACIQUB_22065 [Rhizobium sp. NPDC090275]|uniref:hypothetical protein n=1 Tax=Rhizobium sp. NPDC090275 TaxID=3364498 RepID=UPI003839D1DB
MNDQIDEPEIPFTMPDVKVEVLGIQNEYGAECLRLGVKHLVIEIGRHIDISTLDGSPSPLIMMRRYAGSIVASKGYDPKNGRMMKALSVSASLSWSNGAINSRRI